MISGIALFLMRSHSGYLHTDFHKYLLSVCIVGLKVIGVTIVYVFTMFPKLFAGMHD